MKTVLNPTTDQWSELTARPTASLDDVMPVVDEVFGAIQRQGDQAIQAYSQKFDGYQPEYLFHLIKNNYSKSTQNQSKKL